jgi:chitodextrinase
MKNRIASGITHECLALSFFAAACALSVVGGCGGGGSYSPPPVQDTTPPTAPTNLVATAASGAQINLAWTASTDNVGVTGYKVERCTGAGCANFAQIATPTATTFNDSGLTASTSYSYRVRAADAAGNNSAYSNISSTSTLAGSDTTPPTAPTNLVATAASPAQINLSWTASTDNVGVTGYKVERCQGAGCANFAQIATPTATTFNDSGLTGSTSYSYRVRATDAAGNLSSYSTIASVSTPVPTLTTPSNLTATAVSSTQINLSWTASTETGGTVSKYLVERCQGASCSNFAQIATPTGTTVNDTGLTASTAYSYRVRATDATGNLGGYSNTASATTPPGADTTPPTPPTNLTATAASTTQINLSWTASTDNVGVTGYKVERCSGTGCVNFAQIATPTTITFNDTGLTASTSYSYRVRATDAAGNLSGYSNTATTSTLPTGNVSVAISPRRSGITTSQTMPFTAVVTNDVGSAGVTWSTTGGTLAGQTAAAAIFSSTTAGPFTITATSNADNTKSAAATIGVTDLSGVTTYHNNLSRDGTNTREFALTTSNVTTGSFGKLFSCAVDGEVYAQPLWVPNLAISGGTHNVIFAATQNDSVYAFDADAKPCVQYWKKSFLGTGITPVPPGDTGEPSDINTMIGITGTPVVDTAGMTLYVVAKTKEGSSYHQRLHAMSLIDGSEKFSGPVDLTAAITVSGIGDTGDSSVGCTSTPGNVPFCPLRENQRAGLALAGGRVYVAWASHGDNQPYHGWIMSFNASNVAQPPVVFNDSPNGRESGIWMSGGAPAFDSSGNLYVITGNGDYDGVSDFGDSFLKLSSSLALQDWFTPSVQATLDGADLDLGSGGAVILVDLPSSTIPHVVIGGGKGTNQLGQLYVVNRDNLGQNAITDKVVQQFNLNGMIYSTAAFWQNTLYAAAVGQSLNAFALNTSTSMINPVATSQSSHSYAFPGTTPSVSSSGTTNGIVWALDTNSTTAANASGTAGPAVLFGYDATNLATELWNSSQGTGNAAGFAVKFCVPTVANGKVYVGTQTEITVYGLIP